MKAIHFWCHCYKTTSEYLQFVAFAGKCLGGVDWLEDDIFLSLFLFK
jgi:hypothetical protein